MNTGNESLEVRVRQLREDLAATAREVTALEGRARARRGRVRVAAGLGSLAVVAGLSVALARPGETQVSAQAAGTRVRAPFSVVDSRGRAFLQVTVSDKNQTLTFRDAAGKGVASMVTAPEGRGMDVRDAAGVKAVGFGVLKLGDQVFRGMDVYDAAARHTLNLGEQPDSGGPGVHILNPGATVLGRLTTEPTGGGATGQATLQTTDARALILQP